MEIGTEISKKIRAAIKGKLQELGAYVDEELPDYIMVMVANKKTSQQMGDDLSLFLGGNTIKFTVWLHGVLEKLRSVAVDPASSQLQLDSISVSGKTQSSSSSGGEKRADPAKALAVSSSRSDRNETRVSSSAQEHRTSSSSRLTSAVKPLMEQPPLEAVLDIKPEMDDDDLIDEDTPPESAHQGRQRGPSGRPTAPLYRPSHGGGGGGGRLASGGRSSDETSVHHGGRLGRSSDESGAHHGSGRLASGRSADEGAAHQGGGGRQQHGDSHRHHHHHQDSRSGSGRSTRAASSRVGRYETSSREELTQGEMSRKRKAPVASSVGWVNRRAEKQDSDDVEEEEEEEEEEEKGYAGRSMSSRVSLPSKPERKPSLPPGKQANRNLILKAISEAQDSITKTTAFTANSQRQMVPVAPRTRLANSEEMTAAIQLVQEHLQTLAPQAPSYNPTEGPPARTLVPPPRSLASRLQLDQPQNLSSVPKEPANPIMADVAVTGGNGAKAFDTKAFDTRSFIMSRAALQDTPVRSRLQLQETGDLVRPGLPRTVQASKETEAGSPKFIVTLDGVPSPLGNMADCDMELENPRPPPVSSRLGLQAKGSILQRLQGGFNMADDDGMEVDDEEDEDGATVPQKRAKVLERCRFWPVCKSGDECPYHHPTTQCKTFPNCTYGEKCLFVHPNCKYDGKCTKPDCPFTHVSRRAAAPLPPPRPAAAAPQSGSVCRFFPECKKMDCAFYHPKPCRFATQCKRAGCTFYHPTTSLPPRHALKWTKAQSS
ncbi:zinc finger CCCH domain-containing protein 14 isoform X3 [Gadus morhua]|uniref:zinc finger CCCH domain-containing protein 14 isoform X3 n=1 Tax=Gadus morhua TaxID=8049 RepID=UPI0011B60EB5|nr:zinc finger CCCH domain-containing protein 14 isoform X3 [Gadus morhua]